MKGLASGRVWRGEGAVCEETALCEEKYPLGG